MEEAGRRLCVLSFICLRTATTADHRAASPPDLSDMLRLLPLDLLAGSSSASR